MKHARNMKRFGALLLPTLLLACGSAESSPSPAPAAAAGAGGAGGGNAVGMPPPTGRQRCQPPPGFTGSPQTIDEAVALLNALPKPTSVSCFVESLDRPLTVFSTNSAFSAQPALSTRSPRVFIRTGNLWSSIVIGDPSHLLEFGYLLPGTMRSIKGELKLPLEQPVAPSAPFDRVLYGGGTACGLCHFHEAPAPLAGISNAFSSVAFKPRPETRVSLEALRLEAQTCSWQAEPERCEMLAAVFDGGAVVEDPFPESMETFF